MISLYKAAPCHPSICSLETDKKFQGLYQHYKKYHYLMISLLTTRIYSKRCPNPDMNGHLKTVYA